MVQSLGSRRHDFLSSAGLGSGGSGALGDNGVLVLNAGNTEKLGVVSPHLLVGKKFLRFCLV